MSLLLCESDEVLARDRVREVRPLERGRRGPRGTRYSWRRVPVAARQTHDECRLSLAGTNFDLTTMRPRNLAHDEQSQPEAASGVAAVPLPSTSFQRLEELDQSGRRDGRPAVHDLNANVGLLTVNCDTDRLVGRPVLDRIRDEIAEQLLQARAVPAAAIVTGYHQFDPPVRVRPAELF